MQFQETRILKWAAASTGTIVMLAVALSLQCRATQDDHDVPPAPNILLISVDTVRADHLSAYGYGRKTSPVLDSMAAQGVLFKHAISQAPWTLPSVASLLTSLYPSEHGAIGAQTKLNDDIDTLAEVLKDSGYYTVGIVSHAFLDKKHGLAQGFDQFDESQILGNHAVTSKTLTSLAMKYMGEATDRQPFFLWIHYFDPHVTYVRHREFGFGNGYAGKLPARISYEILKQSFKTGRPPESDIDYVESVYDEEIAQTDYWLGQLLSQLNDLELDESTIVILTADHGEYFMERGRWFHGKDVFEALIHVPLVIGGAIPDHLRGRVVTQSVEISSVPNTVMKLVGIGESRFGGEDLLALAYGNQETPRPTFTEGSYAWGDDHRKVAVIWSGWKLIHNLDDDTYGLYHLETDRKESRNLWSDEREEVVAMRARLKDTLNRFPPRGTATAPVIELDDETIEQLRSLGYVK